MEDKRITAEELQTGLRADVKVLAEQIAEAINGAKVGRIIADSEEPVRDAHAVFRRKAYQRALDLLQKKALQEGFSPSEDSEAVNDLPACLSFSVRMLDESVAGGIRVV